MLHRFTQNSYHSCQKKVNFKEILKSQYEFSENLLNNIKVRSFINRIEEICPYEKLSSEKVIYFLVSFLESMFSCSLFGIKIVS